MLWNHITDRHIASGSRRRKHKGSGLDLIRNYRILRSVEPLYTADLDHIRSCPADIRSHTVQEIRHVYNMRLLGNILQNGQPLSHSSRHHHIDRCPDTYHIKINMLSNQTIRLCDNLAVFNLHVCTKGTESLQMLVYGPAPDITSARKGNLRPLIFAKKSAQQIIRRPDLLHIFIFDSEIGDSFSIDPHCMAIHTVDTCPNSHNCIQQHINIIDIRQIVNQDCLISHNSRRKNSQRRILGSANLDFSNERISAFDNILFHNCTSIIFIYTLAPASRPLSRAKSVLTAYRTL